MDEETIQKIREIEEKYNFPSLEALAKYVKEAYPDITRSQVKKYLTQDLVSQLNKVQRKKETDGHITATMPNEQWQYDVLVLSRYKKWNEGFEYILACVDVFTRRVMLEPMKTKDSVACLAAFKKIVAREGKKPRSMLSDQDAAFLTTPFSKYVQKEQIATTTNALKDHRALGIIDNFAKRLKLTLNKTFVRTKNNRWLDIIQPIVANLNNKPTEALTVMSNGDKVKQSQENPKYVTLTPNKAAEPEHLEKVLDVNLEKQLHNKIVSDLKVGDKVRKTMMKTGIPKGTDPRWSDEVYTVASVKGSTITLNDGTVIKRSDLLQVPPDTTSTETNVVQAAKLDRRKETQQLNKEKEKAWREKKGKSEPVIRAEPIPKKSHLNKRILRDKIREYSKKKTEEIKAKQPKPKQTSDLYQYIKNYQAKTTPAQRAATQAASAQKKAEAKASADAKKRAALDKSVAKELAKQKRELARLK